MTKLNELDVALVGCGRMGSALVQGAVAAQALDPRRLWCSDALDARASQLAMKLGAHRGEPPGGARTLWVIAVKPHHVESALRECSIEPEDLVLSVAAGVRIAAIEAVLPEGVSVARAMPNTPALIAQGITGVLAPPPDSAVIDTLFQAVGDVIHLTDESQFDAVTALSGSGPAFVFVAIEALADGGVAMGLSRDVALQLAKQTVLGAAALAKSETAHPAELKDRVASPGGTTIAGLAALEQAGFRSALIDAIRAATERSRELGES